MSRLCDQRGGARADAVVSIVIFGIEEAVKQAQNGGSGVVIYFRKEGRALGEVTKVSSLCTFSTTVIPSPSPSANSVHSTVSATSTTHPIAELRVITHISSRLYPSPSLG